MEEETIYKINAATAAVSGLVILFVTAAYIDKMPDKYVIISGFVMLVETMLGLSALMRVNQLQDMKRKVTEDVDI